MGRVVQGGELDVLVVGGANMDFLVRGSALPRAGSTVRGADFQEAPGGKGANQAVAAARLGARTAFLGAVGRDAYGRAIVQRLADEEVEVDAVAEDPTAPTGVALVMVDERGEKQILTRPGANDHLTVHHVQAARARFARAKVVLAQLEVPLDTVAAACRLARAAGARVVLDAAPATILPEEILLDVHVLRANAVEAETMTGVPVRDRGSAQRAAENLLRRGVGTVVVAAPGGNLVVTENERYWLPHIPVQAVDMTGAGDAFAAALAVALAEAQPALAAAWFAHAAAALATTRLGAQASLPRRDEVLGLLVQPSPELEVELEASLRS